VNESEQARRWDGRSGVKHLEDTEEHEAHLVIPNDLVVQPKKAHILSINVVWNETAMFGLSH
jgi:hypothetical protein